MITDALGRSILGFAAMSLVLASNLLAQAPVRASARNVVVQIETDRSVYHAGDAVKVRMAFRNVSGRPVRMPGTSGMLGGVRVQDSKGEEVTRTRTNRPLEGGGPMLVLAANEQVILKGADRHEWMDLREWGYDLRVPGQYTIVGLVRTFENDAGADLKPVKSSEVEITITK